MLKVRQSTYINPDQFLSDLASKEHKVIECQLSLRERQEKIYNLIHKSLSTASVKLIESRYGIQYLDAQDEHDADIKNEGTRDVATIATSDKQL